MSFEVSMKWKKTRVTNFSFLEKELMLKYAIEYKYTSKNKESSMISWKDENKWSQIAKHYNSTTTGCANKFQLLKKCWGIENKNI